VIEAKLSDEARKTLALVDEFLYDSAQAECRTCEARPASQMDVGTYLGQIDNSFKLRDGRGAFIDNDGSMYQGYWKGGDFNGKGRIIYSNGTMFDGYW